MFSNSLKNQFATQKHKNRNPTSANCLEMEKNRQNNLNLSPLKVPLELAVSRMVSTLNQKQEKSKRSQICFSSIKTRKNNFDFNSNNQTFLCQIHQEVILFLQKYFGGRDASTILVEQFVQSAVQQYVGSGKSDQILDMFVNKMIQMFGTSFVNLQKLKQLTKSFGLTGLVLEIFKQFQKQQHSEQEKLMSILLKKTSVLQNNSELQNLKNVIIEFVQGMAKRLQNQMYCRLNKQMKRLVMKYNQADQLVKRLNSKIAMNYDKIKRDEKNIDSNIKNLKIIQQLKNKLRISEQSFQKQTVKHNIVIVQNHKLLDQNRKLSVLIHQFKMQLDRIKLQNTSKQRLLSTGSTLKTQVQEDRTVVVSNFAPSNIHSTITRVVPLSPLKRTSSNISRDSQKYKCLESKHSRPEKDQVPGLQLLSRNNTPKNRRNNTPNMVYFA